MIGMGEEKSGLYHLLQRPSVCSSSITFSTTHGFNLWYYRLEHLSFSRLKILNKSVLDITISGSFSCTVCLLVKQKCLPFELCNNISMAPFELVRCDI